ncbi:hypothetical protein [Bradyrhizobium sp. STM 3562]|jgi:hypothetical protein|uniref:hypothetical protein n=1 Tax=Bradyrhizobium sp. STM 3562 TaxID=578924 RepID=UPI00388E709B
MNVKSAFIALAALGGVAFSAGSAFAMPNGIPQAGQIIGQSANIQEARWVCNPWGRCFWRPNWYGAYGYYGPRPYWRWHRWHRWHHWY